MQVNDPSSAAPPSLAPRGDYGFDARPAGAVGMAVLGASLIAAALLARRDHPLGAGVALVVGAWLVSSALVYVHTTRRGKHRVWAEILRDLHLRGDERVLDVGCGRGAVLTMVAKLLPRGRAVGLDIWSTADQSGNGLAAARKNLVTEGVEARCELLTGDMRAMPFADASFDLVVSSLAIHNVRAREGRDRALDEIARILAPGGRVAIADLANTGAYAERLRARGLTNARVAPLGWRFVWLPFVLGTRLVSASKE